MGGGAGGWGCAGGKGSPESQTANLVQLGVLTSFAIENQSIKKWIIILIFTYLHAMLKQWAHLLQTCVIKQS